MYGIVIFFIIVFPFAIKKYLRNSEYLLIVILSNFLISLALFVFFFEEFRLQLWDIYKNGFNSLYTIELYYPFSKTYFLITNLLYFLLCFFVAGISISLGLIKERIRSLFLKSLPIIWLILTNYFFQLYFVFTNELSRNKFIVFIATGLLTGIILLLIYSVFSSKPIKLLYTKRT